jgi:hypothetical protein
VTARSRASNAYRVSGLVFTSDTPFPELAPAAARLAACAFRLASGAVAPPRPVWYHRWTLADGTPWARFARVPSGHLVRFPRLADFLLTRHGRLVRCVPRPATPLVTVRHLFLNQVLPLLLSRRGLVLHASAVVTPHGAVAFLGATGAGKSTLAASFWTAGHTLVADDCLRVTRTLAVPAYAAVRLWPDTWAATVREAAEPRPVAHYTDKLRLGPGRRRARRLAPRPGPLRRLYLITRGGRSRRGGVRIESVTARDALVALLSCTYRLDPFDRTAIARELNRLAVLAAGVPARRLRVPRGLSSLAAVRAAVRADTAGR